jgi:hypothetical protein
MRIDAMVVNFALSAAGLREHQIIGNLRVRMKVIPSSAK